MPRRESCSALPTARSLSEFSIEQIGRELVIFDHARVTYHTLDEVSWKVWNLCDGISSVSSIAELLQIDPIACQIAVGELDNAGLLMVDSSPAIDRRSLMTKAVALGLAIPAIASITAPSASAAGTACSGSTATCCCINGGQTAATCTNYLYAASGYNYQLQSQFQAFCAQNYSSGSTCTSRGSSATVTVAGVTATFPIACN